MSTPNSSPDVSIVIPVYNKLALTKVCVDSIHAVAVNNSFEIIVVDNGSSDGTAEWLDEQEQLGRLRRVNNPENLGFAQGCNLGAAASSGRYVLFLNNDMEVLPGWLEPMATCLDQDSQVGIVGACLIFADQTIQHGGVAMLDDRFDGSSILDGMHLSYKSPLNAPGARKNQLNQAVTGACLMIRPDLFHEIGGFDETYWNGNEDIDLCLKAGELGWKVVYMGDSLIFHYESQSGPERWRQTRANQEHFNRVWRDRLKVDFVKEKAPGFVTTPDNQIRPYVLPRLANQVKSPEYSMAQASVIILTWNALEFTRQCAASLLAHTDPRHELIFVDNGSDPETVSFLTELAADNAPVKVILNEKNLGFAGGNNVGLAAATGQYMCLLNSDTVVTEGWLERLIKPMIDDPRLGLVGPVTNSITGAQKLSIVDYDEDSLVGLDSFAAKVAASKTNDIEPALWIVGYCFVIRRELLLRIGGLDEKFGLGNFEDTDYCLRSFLAGYQSAVVQNCFIHHFGSRSFLANNLDYSVMLEEKFEVFRQKWGLAIDARETGDFQLERLINRGFVPALHFQALPPSPHYKEHPLLPWQGEQWVALGEAEYGVGQVAAAQCIFEAVLKHDPSHSRAANNLACVVCSSDPARAENILQDVLAREPDNEDALWNLAEVKKEQQLI